MTPQARQRASSETGGRLYTAGSHTGVRVRLVAGHRRDPVIKDHNGHIRTVVDGVHQALNAGVQERGVADRADHITGLTGMRDAARDRDRCAHADGGINDPELEPEGVAPDIAGIDRILEDFFYRIERPAVQAAGTEDRGAGGQVLDRFRGTGTGFSAGIRPSP